MILLVNGPNLNLLGEREPEVYGHDTLDDVVRMVTETCAAYGVEVKAFQSNWEGALLDFLQLHRHEAQGVILNPGALGHTSRALADCLRALPCPTIEVHVSNVHAREPWRRESLVAPVAQGQIAGLGAAGYYYAAVHLCGQLAASAAAQDPAAETAPAPAAEAPPRAPEAPAAGPEAAAVAAAGRPQLTQPQYGPAAHGHAARAPDQPLHPAPPRVMDEDARTEEEADPLKLVPVDQMARGDYEPL
jgi:3-dehydroquinate dehydratase-2